MVRLLGFVICEAPEVDDDDSSPFWLFEFAAAFVFLCVRGVGGGCCCCSETPDLFRWSSPDESESLTFLRTLGVDGGGLASSLE